MLNILRRRDLVPSALLKSVLAPWSSKVCLFIFFFFLSWFSFTDTGDSLELQKGKEGTILISLHHFHSFTNIFPFHFTSMAFGEKQPFIGFLKKDYSESFTNFTAKHRRLNSSIRNIVSRTPWQELYYEIREFFHNCFFT